MDTKKENINLDIFDLPYLEGEEKKEENKPTINFGLCILIAWVVMMICLLIR